MTLLKTLELGFLLTAQTANSVKRTVTHFPPLCLLLGFKFLYALVHVAQLVLGLGYALPCFQLSDFLLYFLDVSQFLIFRVIFGEYRGILLFESVQGLTSGVGAECFVSCNGAQFFHLALVFFLCLNHFLLLCLIRFVCCLDQFRLCLHAYHHGNNTGNSSGYQYVWIA